MKGIISQARNTALESFNGPTSLNILEILEKMICMEKALTAELMGENMSESGKRIKWRGKECSRDWTEEFIAETM